MKELRPIGIIKLGSTFPHFIEQEGDFEDWISKGLGLSGERIVHCCPLREEGFPTSKTLAGLVLTGSHNMVTDNHDWSKETGRWLLELIEEKIPILGICYGHQLLAHILGGRVGENENGPEFGSLEVELTKEAEGDELFSSLPSPLLVHCCHKQSVLELPKGATLLAFNECCAIQAFKAGPCWGVQFHPEFSARTTREYVIQFKEELQERGYQVNDILTAIKETPESNSLLRQFALFCDVL